MSVRIYELSKQLEMTNAELMGLLRERGFVVKTASSTVDNISAESLVEEFAPKIEEAAGGEPAREEPEVTEPIEEPKETLVAGPPAAFVKTKEEVDRERQERIESERPKPVVVKAPVPGMIPPPPVVSPYKPVSPSAPPKLPTPESKPLGSPLPAASPVQITPVGGIQPAGPQTAVPPKAAKTGVGGEEDSESKVEEVAVDESKLKGLELKPPIVVRDFAGHLGLKPFRLISELMELGIFASMNQVVDEEVSQKLALKHGFRLEVRHRGEKAPEESKEEKKEETKEDESKHLVARPAIVCILGHVDHGKTTLLDTIRRTDVVAGEAGGITQHIGAYQVEHKEQKVTFIDTPGHAAFSQMRARGAHTTDIGVLVVAADDGFMPQTDEALGYVQEEGVPIIVAINKIDVPGANVDRVKGQMQERNIAAEDWGGETLTVEISALKGERIGDLLDTILLQAEIMEDLKANSNATVNGVIVEAQKDVGQGANASLIVQNGTLRLGDSLISGPYFCKVRALLDDRGRNLNSADPSTPVRVTGWSGPPKSGSAFSWVKNEKVARSEAKENDLEIRKQGQEEAPTEKGATLENIFEAISKSQRKVYRVIVKADVFGTAEALASCLEAIKSEKIVLEVVQASVGAISKNDVQLAHAADATIVGFNVSQESGVAGEAKHHEIEVYRHNIIYELIDIVKGAMADSLEPEKQENKIGVAEVRQVFPIGKSGSAAGCMVVEGRISREGNVRVIRNGETQVVSRVVALKRIREDVAEVRSGYECGIRMGDFDDYEEGDVIECFEIENVRPIL